MKRKTLKWLGAIVLSSALVVTTVHPVLAEEPDQVSAEAMQEEQQEIPEDIQQAGEQLSGQDVDGKQTEQSSERQDESNQPEDRADTVQLDIGELETGAGDVTSMLVGDVSNSVGETVVIKDESMISGLRQRGITVEENGNVAKSDIEALESFSLRYEFDSLDGLQYAKKLNWLGMSECSVTDETLRKNLPIIKQLTGLRDLWLPNNQIQDFSMLFELKKAMPNIRIDYQGNPGEAAVLEKMQYSDMTMWAGQKLQMENPEDPLGGYFDMSKVTYTSSNPNVAVCKSVTNSNSDYAYEYVEGVSEGTATITIAYGGKSTSFNVTVEPGTEEVPKEKEIPDEKLSEKFGYESVLNEGQIWKWDDHAQKIQAVLPDSDVKTYTSYFVYRNLNAGTKDRGYLEEFISVDNNNTLVVNYKDYYEDAEYQQQVIAKNMKAYAQEDLSYYIAADGSGHVLSLGADRKMVDEKVCENAVEVSVGTFKLADGSYVQFVFDDELDQYVWKVVDKAYIDTERIYADGQTITYGLDSSGKLWKIAEDNGKDEAVADGVAGFVWSSVRTMYNKGGDIYSLPDQVKRFSNVKEWPWGSNYLTNSDELYKAKYDYTNASYSSEKIMDDVAGFNNNLVLKKNGELYVVDGMGEASLALKSVARVGALRNHEVIAQRKDGSLWLVDCEAPYEKPYMLGSFEDISVNKVTKTDAQTQVSVGKIDSDITLIVDPNQDAEKEKEIIGQASEMLGEGLEVNGVKIYDITLKKDGQAIKSFDSPLQVTLPVPEEFRDRLTVFHQKDDGALEEIPIDRVSDGKVSFKADKFSPYILADIKGQSGVTPGTEPGAQQGGEPGGQPGSAAVKPSGEKGGKAAVDSQTTDAGRTTDKTVNNKTAAKAAKTSDSAPIMWMLVLMTMSLATIVIAGMRRKNYK